MFVSNNTIDDSAPLIIYEPQEMWYQGNVSTDPGSSYWMETKTWTTTVRATATFRFNGTAVTVIGAKRNNHGNYSVRLDGFSYDFSGFASPDEFQAVLFNASNLTQGPHDVVITNMEGRYLDIDCIQWISSVGDGNHAPQDTTVQDTDPGFQYGPAGAWNMESQFNDSSVHSTSIPGALVNYTFTGDAVSIHGIVGPPNSAYQVKLDDVDVGTYNSPSRTFQSQVLLYHADNLGYGSHTVSLINGESEALLQIDYAVVSSEAASRSKSSGLTLPSAPNSPSSSSHSVVLKTGLVIAIVISAVLIMFMLILLVWWLNRRNKILWRLLHKGYMVQSQFDSSPRLSSPILPLQLPPGKERNRPYDPPPPNRSDTLQTDSTLVAEDGSAASSSPTRLRPLKIVQNLGRIRERSRSPSRRWLLGSDHTRPGSGVSEEDLGRPLYIRTVPHPIGPRLK